MVFGGGKDKAGHDDKAIVLGMVERGGEVITRIVQDKSSAEVVPHILSNVKAGSVVYTDEGRAFAPLNEYGYSHDTVNHFRKEYVRGSVHTNSIEAFWSNVKRSISGTYVSVSKKQCTSTTVNRFRSKKGLLMSPFFCLIPFIPVSFSPYSLLGFAT